MIRRLFQRLRGDDRGAAVIELGLAAPILAAMVIGIVDISNAYARKLTIEQSAQRAIEMIQQTTENGSIEENIVTEVRGVLGNGVGVTLTDNVECTNRTSGARTITPSPHDCDAATQYEARYLLVTITDEFTPMFPIKFGANANGRYPIIVRVGMRTQ